MLTPNEKKWLMAPDYHDAAKFEARVAAKLATARMEINWNDDFSCCPAEMAERECSKAARQDCQRIRIRAEKPLRGRQEIFINNRNNGHQVSRNTTKYKVRT